MSKKYLCTKLLFACCCVVLNVAQAQQSMDFPYNIGLPTRYFDLPPILKEISGIYPDPADTTQLLAIQDERGQIFRVHKKTGAVKVGNLFRAFGDFEDVVAIQRDTFLALHSKGDLYTIIFPEDTAKMQVVKTRIFPKGQRHEVDLEGLTWDATHRRLWVGVKHQNAPWASRAILPFTILSNGSAQAQGDTNWIHLANIQQFLRQKSLLGDAGKALQKLKRQYVDSLDVRQQRFDFAPSGIAIHPVSGNWYILAAKQHLVVVMRPQGNEIVTMIRLDKTRHPQAEGICFDADGTMYLSDEGQDQSPARLWVFSMVRF